VSVPSIQTAILAYIGGPAIAIDELRTGGKSNN
jgi:hypothetical protein